MKFPEFSNSVTAAAQDQDSRDRACGQSHGVVTRMGAAADAAVRVRVRNEPDVALWNTFRVLSRHKMSEFVPADVARQHASTA